MHVQLRKLVAIVLVAAYSSAATAGLQDALDGMFMATATTPAAYSSQTRGGFVGGGVGVRMPVRNINLVAFDPPRFSAGCGGIDLYGGSFSFINADQLTALFRQIAANAAGALFKIAIDSINPQLGKIMEDFQSKLQQLNSMFKNTCAIANQIVNPSPASNPDAGATFSQNVANAVNTAKGAVTDMFDGMNKLFSNKNDAGNRLTTKENPAAGNLVWKALSQTNAGQFLGNPGAAEGNLVRANEIILSLTGTEVLPAGSEKADTHDVNGNPIEKKPTTFAPILTLADMKEGSTSGERSIYIYSCQGDTDCLDPRTTTITFDGMVGYTNKILFGDPTGASAGAQANSLIANLRSCDTAACFTAAQRNFINAVRAPTLKLLRDVQHSPGAIESVAVMLVPIIADELVIRLGEAAIMAARQAYTGTRNVIRSPMMDKSIESLEREIIGLRTNVANETPRLMAATEYVKQVTAANPAFIVATPVR